MKTIATIFAAALALVLQGAFAGAQAVNASGHCTGMTVTDYVSSDASDYSNSTTWRNATDAHLNFTTSGTGCVMITFSGYAGAVGTGDMIEFLRVRTLLDGSSLCMPALATDIFAAGYSSSGANANSITRICKNVTAGAHTVQAQYHSDFGAPVFVYAHTLTVTHN